MTTVLTDTTEDKKNLCIADAKIEEGVLSVKAKYKPEYQENTDRYGYINTDYIPVMETSEADLTNIKEVRATKTMSLLKKIKRIA